MNVKKILLWLATPLVYLAAKALVPETDGVILAIDPLTVAALMAATGALVGGGAQLYSSISGGGTMPGIGPMNPTMNSILDLLGLKMGVHEHGMDAGMPYFYDDPQGTSIFEGPAGEDADAVRRALSDYMYGGPSQAQTQLIDQLLNQGGATGRFAEVDQMLGQISQSALEGATTGFPVDTDFLFEEAERRFRREDLPLVSEIAGAQYGLGSSAFIGSAADASGRLNAAAAEAAARYQDIANARRAQLQIPAANISNAYAAFPAAYASDIMSIENMVDARAMRPWEIFSQMAGLAGPQYQNFYQPGFNPTDPLASGIGALGSSLPMMMPFMGMFGGGGGGGGAPGGGVDGLYSLIMPSMIGSLGGPTPNLGMGTPLGMVPGVNSTLPFFF